MGLLKNWLVRHFKPVLSKSPPIKSPSDRVLIFSVWTAALQECSLVLNECNIPYVMYHGSLSAKQRDDAVRSFRDLSSPIRVMLCTYGSGGVGLDLGGWIDGRSICSRVLLLDMWFNPQIEAQAIDRVHRIYQTEPVQVTRFIMDGSMEERIVAIQNKKKRQCEFVLDLSTAQITHKDTNKQLWKELVDSLQNAYDT
jgi:SNF2 family DNA or RNA helicase